MGINRLGFRSLGDTSIPANTTAQAAPSVAPTSPTQSAPSAYGYQNLPGGFGFAPKTAPVSGNTVFFGTVPGTGVHAGQNVYVGPDNQPYVGDSSAFYFGSGGTVNPIINKAQPVSWADLGVGNADSNVYASTYHGIGAAAPTSDINNYENNLPAGENLVVSPSATIATASGGNLQPGIYPTDSIFNGQGASLPVNPATIPSAPTANAAPTATTLPAPPALGVGPIAPTNPFGNVDVSATTPGLTADQAAAAGVTGGNNTTGFSPQDYGSSAAPSVPSIDTGSTPSTTTAPNYTGLLLIVALVIGGVWLWIHHGKQKGHDGVPKIEPPTPHHG